MNGKERLQAAFDHRQPDRVPVDFGSTAVTGIHASAIARLRQAVLGEKEFRVKIIEPYQMLGEVDKELGEALSIDVFGLMPRTTLFGFENTGWKPFNLFDKTEVLVPDKFCVSTDRNGDLLIYPEGDIEVPPSGRMVKNGYFFNAIIRQQPIVEEQLNPLDNCEEFSLFSEKDLTWYRQQAQMLQENSSQGVILTMPGTAFGDIALVPAPWMKNTKGIRDIEEWYLSTLGRHDYVRTVFEKQCEIALQNLENLIPILGDSVQAVFLTGTDFGTQRGSFISVKSYRDLFKPFHSRVNKLIHQKSKWKTFIHSCGAVFDLIPDFIDAGFDILNPVQCSAAGMDARILKKEFGRHLVFWGGGVDTQFTLPFGTPDDVYRQVRERIEIFGSGGGFVFNAVHNIQGNISVENMRAMFRAVQDSAQS